jgi:anthranilate/para-aminobenzoate synthase component I
MLVDLHRNDLGRVAKFGTVKVRKLMEIKNLAKSIGDVSDDEGREQIRKQVNNGGMSM